MGVICFDPQTPGAMHPHRLASSQKLGRPFGPFGEAQDRLASASPRFLSLHLISLFGEPA